MNPFPKSIVPFPEYPGLLYQGGVVGARFSKRRHEHSWAVRHQERHICVCAGGFVVRCARKCEGVEVCASVWGRNVQEDLVRVF